MEQRLALYRQILDLVSKVKDHYYDLSQQVSATNDNVFRLHTYFTVIRGSNILLEGISLNEKLIIMSGVRLILENWANTSYILRDQSRSGQYISDMLENGVAYARAFSELRANPSIGLVNLAAIPRWTTSSLGQRVALLGEGPEFQYELLSKYLHADVWSVLNDGEIIDHAGFIYGIVGWGLEAVNQTLWTLRTNMSMPPEYFELHDQISDRIVTELNIMPGSTYADSQQ